MSEEKQIIEEMAKVTSEALMSELGIRLDDKFLLRLAKHFYNAGYSKQSKGEWIRYGQDYSQCSLCGKVNTNYNNNNYCPNCGAKMKGE